MSYKTPGVYIEEISKLPPSIAEVETAIPAFIGYTEKATKDGVSYSNKAVRIKSMVEYVSIFGEAYAEEFSVTLATVDSVDVLSSVSLDSTFTYRMYYSLLHYFANGGGPCYIISVGVYTTDPDTTPPEIDATNLLGGMDILKQEDEPTLIVFPDAVAIDNASDFYSIYTDSSSGALQQCADLKDRFAIIDIYDGDQDFMSPAMVNNIINDHADSFRQRILTSNLKYGAAYYPWLKTIYNYNFSEDEVTVTGGSDGATVLKDDSNTSTSLYHLNNGLYHEAIKEIEKYKVTLPPSSAMAGVYASVDKTRGVWKAPANVSLKGVEELTVLLDQDGNDNLNVHSSGKSINAIRSFVNKGIIVWGARTLAGNDNEWRYINVRRFFNMVEESVKKATSNFVFEPNDSKTWTKVRAMIENFLIIQWRNGALAGAKPEQAFFVKVGLGETMTSLDILEGRMNIEIGMAVVRPAEFIILKFSHMMQQS